MKPNEFLKKEVKEGITPSQRTRLSAKRSSIQRDDPSMKGMLASLTAKKKTAKPVAEAQLDEMSPAQKQRLEARKAIGQKMQDVNNIFATAKQFDDKELAAAARHKLSQLAKEKHDLESQEVDEADVLQPALGADRPQPGQPPALQRMGRNAVKSDIAKRLRSGVHKGNPFAKKNPFSLKNIFREDNKGVDTVEMDVQLFLRCLEWAKEDASDDIALHKFVENVVAKNDILTMDDYESLIPPGEKVQESRFDEPAKSREDTLYKIKVLARAEKNPSIRQALVKAAEHWAKDEDLRAAYYLSKAGVKHLIRKDKVDESADKKIFTSKAAWKKAAREAYPSGKFWGDPDCPAMSVGKKQGIDRGGNEQVAAWDYTTGWVKLPSSKLKEDASCGGTSSGAVAAGPAQNLLASTKRTKGSRVNYKNKAPAKDAIIRRSIIGQGIYEAEEAKKKDAEKKPAEKFDYEAWKKEVGKTKKPRGQWSEKTLLMKGKNKVDEGNVNWDAYAKSVAAKNKPEIAAAKAAWKARFAPPPAPPRPPKVAKVKKEPKPRIPRFKSAEARTPLEQKAKDAMYKVWQQIAPDVMDMPGAEEDYQNPYYVAEICVDGNRMQTFADLTPEEEREILDKLSDKTLARLASNFGI